MREPGSPWRLSMEIVVMGDQVPEVRAHLARAQREAGRGIIPLFMGGLEEDVNDETVDTLGKFYLDPDDGAHRTVDLRPADRDRRGRTRRGPAAGDRGDYGDGGDRGDGGGPGGAIGSRVVLTILPSRISATRSQKWSTSAMS
jgi:hypothetical protein